MKLTRANFTGLFVLATVVGIAVLIGCGGGGGGGNSDEGPAVTSGSTAGASTGDTTAGATSSTTGTTGSTSSTTGTTGTTGSTSSTTGTTGSTSSTTGTTGSTSSTTGTTGSTSSTTGTTGSTSGTTGTTGTTSGGGGDPLLTRILELGDEWIYDVVTTVTPLLGSVTTTTAVDTQTVVQVNFLGQSHMAIRSQMAVNLAGGGTSVTTTYRVIAQDPVTHVIQLIGYIDQVGNNVVLPTSVLCPGGLDLGGVWDTITRIGASVVTTTSSIIGDGDISVDAGLFSGHHFSSLQIAVPGLTLGLLCTIDGWMCQSLGNLAKETRIYLGLASTKKIEVELQSTNVD